MKTTTSDKAIAYLTLLSGLSISAVAVYYSVAGLVSIFAASAVPIMVMGVVLEVSKLIATIWLKLNWNRAPFLIKIYLFTAIAILMLITSMGIFGYLSKAHLDQAVPTGDIAAKVELIDTKIQTQKDNIASAKQALTQMDAQVNEMLSRSTDNKGTERAVQIRRQQAGERIKLQKDIEAANSTIAKLNEERAPIAKDLRKVEAEVGPIKYIAALLYGDNPDTNILEKAVRWVIIVIVMVFDPLAVILLLASQYSFQWFRKEQEEQEEINKSQQVVEKEIPLEESQIEEPQIDLDEINKHLSEAAVTQAELDALLREEPETAKPVEQIIPPVIESPPTPFVPNIVVLPVTGDITAPERFGLTKEEPKVEVLEETPEELEAWNKMIAEAEAAADAEAAQRRKAEEAIQAKLSEPEWYQHMHAPVETPKIDVDLTAKPDYVTDDEAAAEALKWAQEQIEEEAKKKESVTWMEKVGNEQIKRTKD